MYPPIGGLKGPWSVSHRGLEPRRFFGDPALLARDNIFGPLITGTDHNHISLHPMGRAFQCLPSSEY